MAKRVTTYSKLSKEKKEFIDSLLDDSELKMIEVNAKKGVIVDLEGNEVFVVLDTWTGFDKREEEKRDEEDDYDEEDEDDLEENLLED
jgi:hypothetical protein